MNVIFFEVDGVLNFEGSEAKAPDGSMGVADSKVKELQKKINESQSKLVLIGKWRKDWDFDDSKCSKNGAYLNKKLERRGLHIMDKTKDLENEEDEIKDWLSRRPNVEHWEVLKGGRHE